MYLALRWLTVMSLAMWILMCALDNIGAKNSMKKVGHQRKIYNSSEEIAKSTNKAKGHKHFSSISFHYALFVAGALLLTVYNRHYFKIKKYIELDPRLDTWCEKAKHWTSAHLKETATAVSDVMLKNLILTREYYNLFTIFIRKHKHKFNFLNRKKDIIESKQQRLNMLLLKKMKDIGEERKQLAKLLLSAINENKNIRALYQLETLCKSRLQRQIECSNKEVRENRSLYNNFQQLYIVVNRENIYLKGKIKRITSEKNECQKKLMCVVNEVFRSNHMYLKEFCSNLIVNTRDNLVTKGSNKEINRILQNYKTSIHETEDENKYNERDDSRNLNDGREEHLERIVTEIPKFKGLPGEYVWTVKDKLGLIGKLYEYDYESSLECGDTLRRIREYSVYHDRDCFLDQRHMNTVVSELPGCPKVSSIGSINNNGEANFLTSSVAFKNFWKTNSQLSLPFEECS